MQGRIIKQISNDYTVRNDNTNYVCKARGKLRNMEVSPLVGDFVEFNEIEKLIINVLKRKNELKRPLIANIDQAIVITSLKQPNFDNNLLDRLLCIIEYNNIKPIIIFTKYDLLNDEEIKKFQEYYEYYQNIGYEVFLNSNLKTIINLFENKVSVFVGQSGAGKSTLLNNLDYKLNIKTAEISKALNRGKHTTRHTELLEIKNGLVADTPGFSAVDFNGMTNSDIKDNFIEFNLYRQDCKYRDCMHYKEDNCEIKKRVKDGQILQSRYNNYIKFIKKG